LKINLHIDRLTVDGVLVAQTPVGGLTRAIEAELVRLVSQPDFLPSSSRAQKEAVQTPPAQFVRHENGNGLASSIAASVVGAIQP
jgi:hypothetical protein